MTVLQALNAYYDRMAARGEAELPGFSREKISFSITLSEEGEPVAVRDLREASGKRLVPQALSVPAAVKRTVAILPNLFWDKSAYVLGRTAGEGKRSALEHEAFKAAHRDLLAGASDPGLIALSRFLDRWTPERFDAAPFSAEMLDANIVFALDGETGYLHQREAAQALLAGRASGEGAAAFCLVTGRQAPVQRLHPTIKGVDGAQTAGAALVSFNLDAFASYGKSQGDNAPTSEAAAFRYGAALNALLDRSASRNRLRRGIGDATIVFWADASRAEEEAAAKAAEDWFAAQMEPPNDEGEAAKIRDQLKQIEAGQPVATVITKVNPLTRFYVLGLSPNAARLSVRYWFQGEFGDLAKRFAAHSRALRIEPAPLGWMMPTLNVLLARTTALLGKFDHIPDNLAGEVMRAILEGRPYPRTLLATAIMRLRSGDNPGNGWHAAVIKACLNRALGLPEPSPDEPINVTDKRQRRELPVALDPNREDTPYQLGRLFAVLESAQYAALGSVNASIGDRYYGAASARPASVFGTLLRGLKNHVSDARKRGRGGWIEKHVGEIIAMLPAELPRTLRLEEQGRFAIGYYHERATRPAKADDDSEPGDQA